MHKASPSLAPGVNVNTEGASATLFSQRQSQHFFFQTCIFHSSNTFFTNSKNLDLAASAVCSKKLAVNSITIEIFLFFFKHYKILLLMMLCGLY